MAVRRGISNQMWNWKGNDPSPAEMRRLTQAERKQARVESKLSQRARRGQRSGRRK